MALGDDRGVERLRSAQRQPNGIGRGVEKTFGMLMTGWCTRCRRPGRGLEKLSASRRYATSCRGRAHCWP